MKRRLFSTAGMLAVLLAFMVLAGCATINRKGSDVTIQASRAGVEFELVDSKGNVIAKAQTPYVVSLRPKAFNGAYTLRFLDADGNPAEQSVKGKFTPGLWILGDIFPMVFAGFVVDAATGAMWVMPSTVTMRGVAYEPGAGQQFFIATLDELRPELRQYLVPYGEWVNE
ncbi:MAG: hypothetical protein LBF95_08255 [Treponema sp.]|jgi:predicted small secreted protein|nr:hypothetical protein [Treponema sp.]